MKIPAFLTDKILGLKTWIWILVIVVIGGGGLTWLAKQPQHATWRYGVCKVYLEEYVRFPLTINIEQGGETIGSAYISFTDVNPFGSQTVRNFECYFSQNDTGRIVLSKVTVDRKPVPDDLLKIFQGELPVLTSQKLDTALPKDLPSDLMDYKD